MTAPDAPPARPLPPPRSMTADALLAFAAGGLFLMLGWPIATWAVAGFIGNPFHTVWLEGEHAGEVVRYADLEGGALWRDAAAFATAIALLGEAALLGVAAFQPRSARTLLLIVFGLGGIGLVTNLFGAAMQIRAGFTQPLWALVGAVLCLGSALLAVSGRRNIR